jgi:ABC-type transport system substrate-binding protein
VSGTDADSISRVKSLDGVTVDVTSSYTFEHVDFNFQFPLFRDKAVRQAVAHCIPRQEILDKLVKPTDGDAVLLQNRMFFPGRAGYADTSGGRYDRVDIAAAKATLEADGWTLDGDVYAKDGQRLEFHLLHKNVAPRSAIAQLIQASCAAAGIAVIDDGDPKWSDRAGEGSFEAVDFSWTGSPLLSPQRSTYHKPAGPHDLATNFGSYSNPQVDALMDVLATETDEAKLVEAANRADTILWDDVATVPLYQFPAVVAWSENIQGVRHNPTFQGLTWNVETWTVS